MAYEILDYSSSDAHSLSLFYCWLLAATSLMLGSVTRLALANAMLAVLMQVEVLTGLRWFGLPLLFFHLPSEPSLRFLFIQGYKRPLDHTQTQAKHSPADVQPEAGCLAEPS